MHEHKFVIGEFGAFCMEAECMYAFSARDIAKILADIANNVSAQQSVQRTRAYCECKKPIEFLYGDIYYCKVCNRPCR